MTAVLIVVGALVGAPGRYLLDRWTTARTVGVGVVGSLPWGLFVVNTVGSAFAGAVVATTSGTLRTFLLVGFCGTFTTFSGFAWESSRLWSARRGAFWICVLGMPVLCALAFWVMWRIAGILVA